MAAQSEAAISAVLTSDNHLGAFYARMSPDRLEQRRDALRNAFRQVVDAALERDVDLFLHAGDLYDRPDPRNVERHFVAIQIQRLRERGIPVVMIGGNHDTPRSQRYGDFAFPHDELSALEAVHLLRSSDRFTEAIFRIRNQSVRVRGLSSDFNRTIGSCPIAEIAVAPQPPRCDVELVLLHYGVEGWIRPDVREPVLSRGSLERLDADLIGVGHLHASSSAHLSDGALLLNPGSTEHLDFGEEGHPTGFWLLQCCRESVRCTYVATVAQPMKTIDLDLSKISSLCPGELTEQVSCRIAEASAKELLLRVRLSGEMERPEFQDLNLPLIHARALESNFHCQIETGGLSVIDRGFDRPVGFGASFDLRAELQAVAQNFREREAGIPALIDQAEELLLQSHDRSGS